MRKTELIPHAQAVNFELAELHWQIGARVRKDILGRERADYGKQVIALLAEELVSIYGKGYSRASLFRMVQFSERFPDRDIVASMMRQLSWTHWVQLIAIDDGLKRDFYTQMCRIERWSVCTPPPRPLLEQKLRQTVEAARASLSEA